MTAPTTPASTRRLSVLGRAWRSMWVTMLGLAAVFVVWIVAKRLHWRAMRPEVGEALVELERRFGRAARDTSNDEDRWWTMARDAPFWWVIEKVMVVRVRIDDDGHADVVSVSMR